MPHPGDVGRGKGEARRCGARVRLGFWSSGLSAYRLVPVRGGAQANISRGEFSLLFNNERKGV